MQDVNNNDNNDRAVVLYLIPSERLYQRLKNATMPHHAAEAILEHETEVQGMRLNGAGGDDLATPHSALKYWFDRVSRMRVVDTRQCLKATGCHPVPSTLKAIELKRLVMLSAASVSVEQGAFGVRSDDMLLDGKTFTFFPLRVRNWLTPNNFNNFHGRDWGRRLEVRVIQLPDDLHADQQRLERQPRQQQQQRQQPQVPSASPGSKLSRAEKTIQDTMERALNSDPYFALVSPSSFHPTRPNGVVTKPTKMVFTKANSRVILNFELTPVQERFLRENSNTVQLRAYSVLIKEDEANAKNRVLWPNDCVIHVNGVNVDVTRRSSSQKVTKSTRERPAVISSARGVNLRPGQNTMRIMGVDARHFAMCVLLVRERPEKEVRALIPPPKDFDHYVSSIKKSLGFSNEDEEDDDIIGPDTAIISVRCPIRMCMMETPARLESCNQACTFDVDSFLELHKETRKWTCPCCGSAGGPKDVRIDGFLVRVMAKLKSDLRCKRINPSSASVSRIEIDKECRWRYREAAGDQQELGEWIELAETRAVELSIQGRAIDTGVGVEKKGAALEDNNTSSERNKKRSAAEVTATEDEIVIDDEQERKKSKHDLNKEKDDDDDDDDDDYDSEEELRNACREAAAMRGNGGANDTVPDIIVIDDSDSEDDVRIVGVAPPPQQQQPQRVVAARKNAPTPLQQLRDLHRLSNAIEEQSRNHQRGQGAHQNGTQPWQREILQQAQARDSQSIRAAAEARQRAERLESERRVKDHEERLRQQRINAMHNGRSEYERSVMANAQAQPFGLQPQYYHNVNNPTHPPPPSHPQQPVHPPVSSYGYGHSGYEGTIRAPLRAPYKPPPPLPRRQTQEQQQQQQQQPPPPPPPQQQQQQPQQHHQSVRFVCRPPNPANRNTNNNA